MASSLVRFRPEAPRFQISVLVKIADIICAFLNMPRNYL